MAKVTRVLKGFLNLSDDDKKEFLETLSKEEDLEIEEKTEVKEETDVKKEPEVETKTEKKEVKEEPTVGLTKKDLEEILTQFASKFVTKEEIEDVKGEVEKVTKKAKPFGESQKTPKEDKIEAPKLDDILAKLNSQFV